MHQLYSITVQEVLIMGFVFYKLESYFTFLIYLTVCFNCVQPELSLLQCNKHKYEEEISLPQVVLYSLTELNSTQAENEIHFETGKQIEFKVECSHNKPIKWVFNADLVNVDLKEVSKSYRSIGNFSDESTYEYKSIVKLILPDHNQQTLVLICQTVDNPCARRTVLSSYDKQIRKSVVKTLLKNEENISSVIEFDNEISARENLPTLASSNTTCPLKFKLYYVEKAQFFFNWTTPGGTKNEFRIDSPEAFENFFRFSTPLEESCIDFRSDLSWNEAETNCPGCPGLWYTVHHFKPLVFYYAVGDHERVLKVYFDIQRNLYYSWEKAEPKSLVQISSNGPFYKGQEIPVACYSSPVMFAFGTQIAWSIEGENFTQGFVQEIENIGVTNLGVILATGKIPTDKSFLDRNNINSLNISCISPIWNSSGWVTSSKVVPVLDSKLPEILRKDEDSVVEAMLNQNYTFKCEAQGVPLPELEIIPPQLNLNFTMDSLTTENSTELIVTIPKFEAAYEGKYNCVATSLVGVDFKIFEVVIPKEFPFFAKIIIICASVACFLFIVTSLGLVYKLRKEKQEFILLTEEAIRKFKEGFKNTTGIDFDSQAEYQDYEVPFTRWGIGGTMLGKGAFGVVQKGTVQLGQNKTVVAVKTVNSPKDVADFENSLMELTIMSYIGSHEHIVNLIAACTDNIQRRSILIGVEFCANGDLLSYLHKRKALFHSFVKDGKISVERAETDGGSGPYANAMNIANFSTVDLYRWSYQIANGMEFLESKKVLHADLAARNVLITQDKIAKISDFGLSRQLLDSNNYTKKTSSPLPWRWMALESLRFQQFSSKSDVWAFGITLYEIFSLGAEPWPGLAWTIEFVNELEKGRRLVRPNHGTENMYNTVMLECWRNEPEERITFTKVKQFFETAIQLLNSAEGKDNSYSSGC